MTQNATTLQRGRASLIALWLTQVALALMFLMAGGSKLAGVPAMVTLFGALGLGQWFRYVTGVIEATSGILLLIPSAAIFGALLLIPTMLGAIVTKRVRCPRLSGDATSALARSDGRRMGPSPSASNVLTNPSAFSEVTTIRRASHC